MKTLFFLLMLGTTSLAAAKSQEIDSRRSDATPERISNPKPKAETERAAAAHVEMLGATSTGASGLTSIGDLVRHEVTWLWVGEDVERLRVHRLR